MRRLSLGRWDKTHDPKCRGLPFCGAVNVGKGRGRHCEFARQGSSRRRRGTICRASARRRLYLVEPPLESALVVAPNDCSMAVSLSTAAGRHLPVIWRNAVRRCAVGLPLTLRLQASILTDAWLNEMEQAACAQWRVPWALRLSCRSCPDRTCEDQCVGRWLGNCFFSLRSSQNFQRRSAEVIGVATGCATRASDCHAVMR